MEHRWGGELTSVKYFCINLKISLRAADSLNSFSCFWNENTVIHSLLVFPVPLLLWNLYWNGHYLWLLLQEGLKFCACAWRLVSDLLVVSFHFLLELGNVFGIQELVGWCVLEHSNIQDIMFACSYVLTVSCQNIIKSPYTMPLKYNAKYYISSIVGKCLCFHIRGDIYHRLHLSLGKLDFL